MLAARACYLLLPVVGFLVVSTALCHSLADLLWLSCAATAAAHDCTPPGSDAEGHPSQPEVGGTGMDMDSNPGEFLPDRNPGQEDYGNDSSIPTTWQLVCTPLLRGVPA